MVLRSHAPADKSLSRFLQRLAVCLQEDKTEMDPMTASVYKLADLVYGDRAHLAAAAIPCALTGVGVRLYRDYVAELKVQPLRWQPDADNVRMQVVMWNAAFH